MLIRNEPLPEKKIVEIKVADNKDASVVAAQKEAAELEVEGEVLGTKPDGADESEED